MKKALRWLVDNEAAWMAGLLVSLLELAIAWGAKHGLDPEFVPMLHGLVPLLVAPLLRRAVVSRATVERVASPATAEAIMESKK